MTGTSYVSYRKEVIIIKAAIMRPSLKPYVCKRHFIEKRKNVALDNVLALLLEFT